MRWLASLTSSLITMSSIALLYFCTTPTSAHNSTNDIIMIATNTTPMARTIPKTKTRCVNIPPSGIAYAEPDIHAQNLASVSVTSLQTNTMQLTLSPINHHSPKITLIIPPNSRKTVSIPSGEYAMSGQIGQHWCSPKIGFTSHSMDFTMNDTMHASASDTAQLTFTRARYGIQLKEIHIPNGQFSYQGKTITIHKGSDGHFHISGSINGTPVVFMIDTGASTTSVPPSIARKAYLNTFSCHTSIHTTANGTTAGCDTHADIIRFGAFSVQHAPISVLPRLNTALLGMSTLKLLHINIDGDLLTLSPKR